MSCNAKRGAAGLAALVAMQVFGRFVLWDGMWSVGRSGEEISVFTAFWWGWTAIQIALGVVVGIAMYRGAMESIRAHRAAVRREVWAQSPMQRMVTRGHPGIEAWRRRECSIGSGHTRCMAPSPEMEAAIGSGSV